MDRLVDWAVVGENEMSQSQKRLRSRYPAERIRKISMMDAIQGKLNKKEG